MNRIILIGNGFDLAHGLKTSYRDFIDDYWTDFAKKYPESSPSSPCEDEFVKLEKINGPKGEYDAWIGKTSYNDPLCIASIDFAKEINNVNSYSDLKQLIAKVKDTFDLQFSLSFKNGFWEHISKHISDKNWVDIENEYYENLRKCEHDGAEILNKELKIIETLLEKYLSKIENETTFPINKEIKEHIFSPIIYKDIPQSKERSFISDIISRIKNIKDTDEYDNLPTTQKNYIENNWLNENSLNDKIFDDVKDWLLHDIVPRLVLRPNNIMFLNFNYTTTHNQYIIEEPDINSIHIHGELNNPKNPIIFGYGDELAEDYKQIENLNDNEYLKNVKSIRYLETDNYRKMLSFIESEPYQIFVMGHSCGNSDRTLLNTLFEHKNCVSIKPFYHLREDGTNNYNEIVQNISRNFTNKAAMRECVVNKTYCEPLTI
ncbi:MAG: bacteriophage abortive infection AbiH family protein [Prevotella sp.]|jgi:hypothetical protein|nr:bacteriophage abortive infection AbiH family protein [Prevotella sp.]